MRIASFKSTAARATRPGFTLVELLLVITIIVIVVGLILVALSQLQNRARATSCLVNQRQIALANMSYANDNDGRLVNPRTDSLPPAGGMRATRNCWVNTAAAGGLVSGSETVKSLEGGALWEYLSKNEKAYVSPMDPTGRVRSYSMNSFVGVGDNDYGRRADDWWVFPDPESADMPELYRNTQLKTVTLAQIPQPSRTMATITEHDRDTGYNYNLHGFSIQVGPPAGLGGLWIDTPALWNTGRVNVAFLDGSIDAPNIVYEQLATTVDADSDGHDVTEVGSRPAFRFMSTIMLPGIVRPELQ
jgi:prepilin-type N-terminal cleavage/methylation domain-containing protein/prepilin-type processing-associated H-X9-DG protein